MLAALATALIAGCTAPAGAQASAAAVDRRTLTDTRAWDVRRPATAGESESPGIDDPNRATRTGAKNSAAPSNTTLLPAYAVAETAFSDFGMSVKTNFDVQWGGHVAWMVVTAIEAGSSAARQRLGVGDRILAIDGRPVTAFDRDAMLAALFHRKQGERSRLLVLGPKEALPRFVTLVAHRP